MKQRMWLTAIYSCEILLAMVYFAVTLASDGDDESSSKVTPSVFSDHEKRSDGSQLHKSANVTDSATDSMSDAVRLYRKLFEQKRTAHKEAIMMIVGFESHEKQQKMIKLLLTKLFTVLTDSKVRLTMFGFMPGDPFPKSDDVKDALSTVLENVVFAGDMLLRLPDHTHALLRENRNWRELIEWGVSFCNDTAIFGRKETLLLKAMAQELNLVEADPDYVNPYKQETLQALAAERESEMAAMKKPTKSKNVKEKKKTKTKGPRMTSSRRDEL